MGVNNRTSISLFIPKAIYLKFVLLLLLNILSVQNPSIYVQFVQDNFNKLLTIYYIFYAIKSIFIHILLL